MPVPVAPGRVDLPLSLTQARESPCLSCPTSPCCNLLKLHTVDFKTVEDVDFGLYLLNFEGLILQMDISGTRAHVYLQQACRHLDSSTGFCRVHRTSEQPSICVHYNEYKCSYRQHMIDDVDSEVPLVDHDRMLWYASHLTIHDSGRIDGFPDGEAMVAAFASMPLDRDSAQPHPKPPKRLIATIEDSCEGCAAWCCRTLLFERPIPTTASQVDEFKYCLGFPSVELGVTDHGWNLLVHTTCRHLQANRCSIFGMDTRPKLCQSIDAVDCQYLAKLGTARPEGFVTLGLERFSALADSIVFDEVGRVVAVPPVEELRPRIEPSI
jgi:Fe-S-cluster containining protein